jgi:hypothetical protein
MTEFISEQFSLSTADEEQNFFYDGDYKYTPSEITPVISEGTFRIIDGKIFMIVPGSPIDKNK